VKVLLVGAGAVGQVLGLHLQRAGAEVTIAVRSPSSVQATTLWRLSMVGAPAADTFAPREVVSQLDSQRFELVVLTVPSDALGSPWLATLSRAFEGATVVGLQPGLDDRRRLLALGVSEARLVRGLVSLISYQTPLTATDRLQEPGYAYWLPPLVPFAFDGPEVPVREVVRLFRRAGLSAKRRPGLDLDTTFFTAVLLSAVSALESKVWSLARLAEDPSLLVEAAGQALAITALQLNRPVPMAFSLISRAGLVRLGIRIAPRLVPFDVEAYARVHFTKVGAQSTLLLGELVTQGRARGLAVDALEKLAARV
jgi:hypothetical protein